MYAYIAAFTCAIACANESAYGGTIKHTQRCPHVDTIIATIFVSIECALESTYRDAIEHAQRCSHMDTYVTAF